MGSISDLKEIKTQIGEISKNIKLELPGSSSEKAKEMLKLALAELQKDNTKQALVYIRKAKLYSLPEIDFILSHALKLRKDGEKLLKSKKFQESISKFQESIEKYNQALYILEEMSQDERKEKVRNTLETTENLLKIANFRRVYQRIKEAQNEQEIWDAIRELQTIEVPMEDDRFDALIEAHRKIIIMQLASVVDLMIEAAEMYKKEDWFSAKKTFEKVKETLYSLENMAKKYDLVEEIGNINELIKACDNNLYGISELLETAEVPKGWRLMIPEKESFVITEEESTLEEFLESSINFETRFEQIREKYRIIRLIGEGAFSYVYEAKNVRGHKVALKVLKYLDKESTSAFMREFAAAQKLDHENIVKIFKADPYLGYLEMELASGSLEDIKKPVSPSKAGKMIFEVSRALYHAHSNGVLHRDIKPSNILLFGDNTIKLGDWGLARLAAKATRKSSLVRHKTILYASPEQIQSPTKIDHRSDIFQLGIVFYEILTGKHPFSAEYEAAIVNNILHKEIEPPSHYNPEAAPFDKIVMKMLEKDPEKRYQTVRELQHDLKEVLIRMGLQIKDSVGSMQRRQILAENALLHLKLVVDGSSPNIIEELSRALKHLEALYHESGGDRELKDLCEQIDAMVKMEVKPTEDTLKNAMKVLRRWV